jgi:hypothetical protein
MLRTIAERNGWRQVVLVAGALRPINEISIAAIDELLVDVESLPVAAPANDDNVVRFPGITVGAL